MKILAIDTSGTTASAAIADDYTVLGECAVSRPGLRASSGGKTHSETLLPMIHSLFDTLGLTLADADAIACTNGPGSFTGLRIGAATAKGLAFAANKPLIAVPTLDAMAYTVTAVSAGTWVVPLMDARRGQVYGAVYRSECTQMLRLTDYRAEPLEDLLARVPCETDEHPHIVFLGDGADLHRDAIREYAAKAWPRASVVFAPPAHNRPRAACVAGCAMAATPQSADEFSLCYIRKPQAERERGL